MAYKKSFGISSAYGQLILLVFLPILVLALVGGVLVFYESRRASQSEQQFQAEAVLLRYKSAIANDLSAFNQPLTPQFINQADMAQALNSSNTVNKAAAQNADVQKAVETTVETDAEQMAVDQSKPKQNQDATSDQATISKQDVSNNNNINNSINNIRSLHSKLARMQSDNHVQRVALVNQQGQELLAVGDNSNGVINTKVYDWANFDSHGFYANANNVNGSLPQSNNKTGVYQIGGQPQQHNLFSSLFMSTTTAYLTAINASNQQKLWLVVEMDNEPLQIAQYRIMLALAITGLLTLLILLLSLNIYAKRWIAPIYEMRLQLQSMDIDTLYKPMPIESRGELNLLQQDLVKTLRRLHKGFQELKDHAKQTEDDLRLAFDEMEMQNISIREARDAAISTSQTKSAFLANISHELRTPLNSIDGFINLLSRGGNLDAEQSLYVQTIRKSSAHLLALVNDVLDFSKIEAGKLVLDRYEFNLYDTIHDVVDMLSPVAAEKGLRTAVLFYNDVPHTIEGDALRLKQVLTNLVGNAIKFTDNGEVIVRVNIDEQYDNYLMIAIQDSGRGVTTQDQKLLFKNFSQGDPSTTRQYGGTGLGLVISKQLTRMMGGDIGYFDNAQKNVAKQGSTFWFRVPANVDVLEAAEQNSTELPVLSPLASTDEVVHMLAWINHAASIQVLKASLNALPIELTQANSLAGVLNLLKEQSNHWDWVIVDNDTQDDMMALLKQIRLHYQGKLAVFGYQVGLQQNLLERYRARGLYEPLGKRQLYQMLDTQTPVAAKVTQKPWQGFTVLAVDDHPPNLLVLEALLNEQGIEVITANSGFEAIEIINRQQTTSQDLVTNKTKSQQQIDLIFMDIQMPRMSGIEAAKQIRNIQSNGEAANNQSGHDENSQSASNKVASNKSASDKGSTRKKLPIIALTAHGLSDDKDKLIEAGINDYVGKPISQPQLLQVLQRWLGGSADNPVTSNLFINELASTNTPGRAVGDAKTTVNTKTVNIKNDENKTKLAVIDWQDALIRSANKPELAAKLIVMMIQSCEQEKQELTWAWADKNREKLAQISHRILGASRYTGVPELRQASQDFEDKCLLNVQHNTPTQFAMLTPSYNALQVALDNLMAADLNNYPQLNDYPQLNQYQALDDKEGIEKDAQQKHADKVSENDMTWKIM